VGGPVNQDATCAEILGPGLACFGVFDGHGEAGGLVSNYVATKLPNKIREVLSLTHPGGVSCL
jgi:serine/threonine protein phosphatase PrpC